MSSRTLAAVVVGVVLVACSLPTARGLKWEDLVGGSAGRQLLQDDGNVTDCAAQIQTILAGMEDKIVGGTVVNPPFKYPYIVNLVRYGLLEFCGGSLIAPNVVLTAAHCEKTSTSVWIGRHDLSDTSEEFTKLEIAEWAKPNPSWNPSTNDNDIILIRLKENAPSKYPPIAIDGGQTDGTPLISYVEQDGTHPQVTVMGWGTTSFGGQTSDVLREVTVPGFSRASCNAPTMYQGLVTPNMVCAAAVGADSCQGDSGGPLIVSETSQSSLTNNPEYQYGEDVQVGIVSWGASCAALGVTSNGAVEGFPGVYVRLANYAPWIASKLAEWGTAPKFAQPMAAPTPPPKPAPTPAPETEPAQLTVQQVGTTATTWCWQLPDHFLVMKKLPICGTSKDVTGTCMNTGPYNYATASSLCSDQGGRLCTIQELLNGEVANTGCGTNNKLTWTSTTCGNGPFGHVVGLGGNGHDYKCLLDSQGLEANRCCGGPSAS